MAPIAQREGLHHPILRALASSREAFKSLQEFRAKPRGSEGATGWYYLKPRHRRRPRSVFPAPQRRKGNGVRSIRLTFGREACRKKLRIPCAAAVSRTPGPPPQSPLEPKIGNGVHPASKVGEHSHLQTAQDVLQAQLTKNSISNGPHELRRQLDHSRQELLCKRHARHPGRNAQV